MVGEAEDWEEAQQWDTKKNEQYVYICKQIWES